MNIAVKNFEQFCQDNEVKPTNMKADFYLAGFMKGQSVQKELDIDRAVEWLVEHEFFACKDSYHSTAFREAMKGGEQ